MSEHARTAIRGGLLSGDFAAIRKLPSPSTPAANPVRSAYAAAVPFHSGSLRVPPLLTSNMPHNFKVKSLFLNEKGAAYIAACCSDPELSEKNGC